MFASIIAAVFVIIAVFAFVARGVFKSGVKAAQEEVDKFRENGTQTYEDRQRKEEAEDKVNNDSFAATGALGAALVCLGIAGIVMFFACSAIVEAKQVGVVSTYGKVHEQTMKPGWNWKTPFDKVTEIDATTQTDEYKGEDAIQVRLKDGNTAEVYTTVRWSISSENASQVYSEFRSDDPTDSLRKAMVSTQFKAASNAEFASFDPLSLAGIDGETPDYKALAKGVQDRLENETEGLVKVRSVTVSLIKLDKRSQKHLDDYVAQVAKTRVANEAKETATAQAAANRELASSIAKDPNVLVNKCLDTVAEAVASGASLPAGFNCMPGSGTGVVIPSTR